MSTEEPKGPPPMTREEIIGKLKEISKALIDFHLISTAKMTLDAAQHLSGTLEKERLIEKYRSKKDAS